MSALFVILSVIYILGCIGVIGLILMQKKRASGIGNLTGGGNGNQTYWDKNKGRSVDGQLEKYTKIGALILAVYTIVLCVVV